MESVNKLSPYMERGTLDETILMALNMVLNGS